LKSGKLRRKPRSDKDLLHILKKRRWEKKCVPRFAEAKRGIRRGNLLDAVVALLTPFGLQSGIGEDGERSGEVVLVHLMPKFLKRLYEEREERPGPVAVKRVSDLMRGRKGDTLLCHSNWDSDSSNDEHPPSQLSLKSAIIVQNLTSRDDDQRLADTKSRRRPKNLLHSLNSDASAQTIRELRRGLVYDLSRHADVVAFVKRILVGREEFRDSFVESFAMRCERGGWDLKHDEDVCARCRCNALERSQKLRPRKTMVKNGVRVLETVPDGCEEVARKMVELDRKLAGMKKGNGVEKTSREGAVEVGSESEGENDFGLRLLFEGEWKEEEKENEGEEGDELGLVPLFPWELCN
jgi:hypothetical protein